MEYKLQTTSSRDRGHIHGMQYYIIVFFVQPCLKNTQPQSSHNKYFNNFDTFNTPATTNPVDEWLNTPPVSTATNRLQYWAAMLASGHPLARMVLDFLSVPGQCMSVYHSLFANFSSSYIHWCREGLLPWGGGLTVSKMRHSLSNESTQAASVLGSWCDLPGAVPCEEIMTVFKDKGKRPKNNNVTAAASSEDVDVTWS